MEEKARFFTKTEVEELVRQAHCEGGKYWLHHVNRITRNPHLDAKKFIKKHIR